MKAHIVGGGFGGLAAAVCLVRNAGLPGRDITIYEAGDELGGGLYLQGTAQTGYNLPGAIFDKEFRCAFDLLAGIPSANTPGASVRDEFFAFNAAEPRELAAIYVKRGLERALAGQVATQLM